ncbi:FecR family protein [Sphingobacterium psychroaquaticum]|uniref:FecR family protein n=1 Tax=Sphingobacterium psychroaquaticum TaxID=561061 RepID=A0A1X7KTD8_9SPHI|nr:FecR family protein [Sphingobacterium psychroaquaticum]SMG44739.1 FecR family protein [Sphingobacterium psychroaquaticum]
MKQKYDAAALIRKYHNGTATDHERWLVESFMLIEQEDEHFLPDEARMAQHLAKIERNLAQHIALETAAKTTTASPVRWLQSPWLRIAALLIVCTGIAFLVFMRQESQTPSASAPSLATASTLITPGGNKAYLQTADGQAIDLNDTQNTIHVGDKVSYGDGTVVWSPQTAINQQALNALHTPKGGNYTIVLSDGSRVTLNASSTLRYPNHFSANERTVELHGEAFFEVRASRQNGKKIPFIVKTKSHQIEVTGTAFNVKSYEDEKQAKTTLIHGRVQVRLPQGGAIHPLLPGQEARIHNSDIHIAAIDTAAALDWKNGLIYFNDESLVTIMKKIERWYDIDVEFKNVDPNIRFGGSVSKYKNLSDVLRRLELTGDVTFITKGRRVIVTK